MPSDHRDHCRARVAPPGLRSVPVQAAKVAPLIRRDRCRHELRTSKAKPLSFGVTASDDIIYAGLVGHRLIFMRQQTIEFAVADTC
jgi:hypothetical protein